SHILLPYASSLGAAHERLAPLVTEELLSEVVALVPDPWLEAVGPAASIGGPAEQRAAYVRYLGTRVGTRGALVDSIEEVRHAA
ncbi:MAG: aminotransferase class I and II, partial [Chloroflexota bacterium]